MTLENHAIRRIAVRARLLVSGDPIKGPLKSLGLLQHYRIEGLKEGPQLASIMPRDTSLSDSGCTCFQYGCLLPKKETAASVSKQCCHFRSFFTLTEQKSYNWE